MLLVDKPSPTNRRFTFWGRSPAFPNREGRGDSLSAFTRARTTTTWGFSKTSPDSIWVSPSIRTAFSGFRRQQRTTGGTRCAALIASDRLVERRTLNAARSVRPGSRPRRALRESLESCRSRPASNAGCCSTGRTQSCGPAAVNWSTSISGAGESSTFGIRRNRSLSSLMASR